MKGNEKVHQFFFATSITQFVKIENSHRAWKGGDKKSVESVDNVDK